MKKILSITILFTVIAASAFSEFNANGGIEMMMVPLQMVTRNGVEDLGNIWLGAGVGINDALAGIKTQLILSGDYEKKIGFASDLWFLYSNNGANLWDQPAGNNPNSPNSRNPNAIDLRLGDFAVAWYHPTDYIEFALGRFVNGEHIGKIHNYWLSPWTVGMYDGNNIFMSHSAGGIGFLAEYALVQVEGLIFDLFVPQFAMPFIEAEFENNWLGGNLLTSGGDQLNDSGGDNVNRNANRAARIYERVCFTVGYEVKDSFHARLQYVGANPLGLVNWKNDTVDNEPHQYLVHVNAPRIEAAFALMSVPGLLLDIGVKSWIPISDWYTDVWDNDIDASRYIKLSNTGTYWGGIGFGLGLSYDITDAFTVNFRTDGDMLRSWRGTYQNKDTVITNPLRLSFHLWPSYTFMDMGTLTLSVGINYIGRNSVDIGGNNPNEGSDEWERSDRLRFGMGISWEKEFTPSSAIYLGLAYCHGTGEDHGNEPRTISIPIGLTFVF
jgi:hypothetical protein